MKKINDNIFPSESEYESGNIQLSNKQIKLLEEISNVLNGRTNNYINFPNVYSERGLNAVLKNQVQTKLDNGTISISEAKIALNLIDTLRATLS